MSTDIRTSTRTCRAGTGPTNEHAAAVIAWLRRQVDELHTELAAERISPTTGLPARRHFTRLATAAYPDAAAVLLADLDGLKTVNDTRGHAAGDVLLAEVAERLRTALGTSALLGSLGGDEFAAVLPLAPARHHLDRVHDWVTEPLILPGVAEITPSISIGAVWREQLDGLSFAEALHAADVAMYDAKAAGGGWRLYHHSSHGTVRIDQCPPRRIREHGYSTAAAAATSHTTADDNPEHQDGQP